jgi:hypothetical protein
LIGGQLLQAIVHLLDEVVPHFLQILDCDPERGSRSAVVFLAACH